MSPNQKLKKKKKKRLIKLDISVLENYLLASIKTEPIHSSRSHELSPKCVSNRQTEVCVCPPRDKHRNGHSCTIWPGQKLETAPKFIKPGIDEWANQSYDGVVKGRRTARRSGSNAHRSPRNTQRHEPEFLCISSRNA